MGSSISQLSKPVSNFVTSYLNGEEPKLVLPTREEFYATYQHQNFSLPNSIIFYMAKNPSSSKVYKKMVESCKYFFVKNSIIIVSDLSYYCDIWKARNDQGQPLPIVLDSSRLWITDKFILYSEFPNSKTFASSIIPNIYRCDAKHLSLANQDIYVDELLFLASNVEKVHFRGVTVRDQDGSILPLENIVKLLPKLKSIRYISTPASPTITARTFNELLQIPHFTSLDNMSLWNIPEAFDLDSFYEYMKENKHTKFCLDFTENLNVQHTRDYKLRLLNIINEIIATEAFDYIPPIIRFSGLNATKLAMLEEIVR